jgi:hypothetical protein
MRHRNPWRVEATAVAGAILLAAGSPITFGDDASRGSLQVLGLTHGQGTLTLTLWNTGQQAVSGRIVVSVMVDGERTLALVPFTVWGGQKACVRWTPPTPGGRIIDAGIIVDDGAPI